MSRSQKKPYRTSGGPAFVQLFHWIRKTDAWLSLGPYARLLYIEIRARYTGGNNGAIIMSYREAQELLGCSNRPIPAAFAELVDRGFIVATQKGSFSWKVRFDGAGRATTWRLTEMPQDYPERSLSPSYEFKEWAPPVADESKTRPTKCMPMAYKKRAIDDDMAYKKRAKSLQNVGHSGQSQRGHGLQNVGTIISTISLQPIGQVSSALLRTKLVGGKAKKNGRGSS